jgi:serine/threonine protein kinase
MPKRLNRVCFNVTIRSPSFQEYPLNTDAAGTAPPDAFGPFRVLHQIGAGALGPVFRAYQPEQDRLVAVKVFRIDLPPERAHQLVAQLERLIAADLSHAGIAAPLATGITDVSAYLAMDFVAADSLDMVIRDQQATTPADAVRIAIQLASALDLAAAIDITHGVLHPRDVLLSADDVRMTGIGIAHALEEVGFSAPVRRPYTAPERANGRPWDRRADVFSLAALVFELLTRRRISGPGDQPLDSFARVAGASADALDKVFDRALAERPHDRFATAGDFARALQAAVERKRSVASRVGPSIRPPIPEPEIEPSTPVAAEELPLFTDSLLGEKPELPAADATPPPLLDPSHETLAPDVPFRDVPASTVESLHEPELRPYRPGPVVDGIHSTPPAKTHHPLSVDDFSEAVRHVPPVRHEPPFNIDAVLTPEADVPTRPAPFESVEAGGRSSSGVWPLMLALVVGIALGFGMAMLLLGRDRVPLAPTQAATSPATGRPATDVHDEPIREVTEQTVAAPPKPAAQPSAATTTAEPPRPVPNTPAAPAAKTPAPAATASLSVKPGAAKPTTTTPSRPAVGRNDNRAANTPSPRAQTRPPAAAAKPTPTRPGTTATRATPAPGRGANRAATPPAKAAAQTAPKAESGSLVVESRPSGASVFLDGRRVGTTPLVLDTVKAGQYTIGLDIDGYKRWATSVRVTSGERSRVAASLER